MNSGIKIVLVMTLAIFFAGIVFAEEASENKVKGVDVVPEAAVSVLKKVNAFFQGDLTWTMPAGKDKYKDDYTVNPLGNKVPSSTLGKYDDGVR